MIDPEDHVDGPPDAPLELVMYGDFQCPYCAAAQSIVRRVRERLDGVRRAFGVRMHVGEREVAEREAQPVAELLVDAPHHRLGGHAERALEVAVHDELERRVGGPLHVVAGAERGIEEVGHGRLILEFPPPWATSSS